jgi:hypothetical protein
MPFYTYSSGMQARLQFAVALHRSPDILLIDEALSTGDGYFVNKSRRRVEDICNRGSTVMVVSHSIHMIESLCHRAMILHEGEVAAIGPAKEVGTEYRAMLVQKELAAARRQASASGGADVGSGEVTIEDVRIVNDDPASGGTDYVYWDRPMTIRVRVRADEPVEDPRFLLQVYTAHEGTFVAQVTNSFIDADTRRLGTASLGTVSGTRTIDFRFPRCPFGNNRYYLSFGMMPAKPRRKTEDIIDYYVFRRISAYFQVVSFPEDPASITRTVIVEPPVRIEVGP